jgi:hypothetical protein
MSKGIAREVKLEVLKLYRDILKLHYTKLNEEMRVFGDYFVKSEFTLNYKQADSQQIKLFIKQWKDYANQLKSIKDVREVCNYNEETKLKTKLDIDQKKLLDDLKETIENKNI